MKKKRRWPQQRMRQDSSASDGERFAAMMQTAEAKFAELVRVAEVLKGNVMPCRLRQTKKTKNKRFG